MHIFWSLLEPIGVIKKWKREKRDGMPCVIIFPWFDKGLLTGKILIDIQKTFDIRD